MAFKPIQIIINAKDNASAVFGRLHGAIAAVGTAVAGYFSARLFAGGIQSAADFEAAMSRVKSVADGTAEDMDALTRAAQEAGATTSYTSVQAAGALENLSKAGLSAKESIAALPSVLSLAKAGGVDLGEAAEYVTKAVMGLGLAFEDSGRVADVLAKGANATNTSVSGLAQALSYAAPVARTLGLSLEDTVAIIGKFADAGIDASRAGTALNSILSQFSDPASKFRRELGSIGIVTGDFNKALRQLAASGARGQKAIAAVGLEAGPALRALLGQGMPALDGLIAQLQQAGGSAAETAAEMENNLHGAMTGLSSAWSAVVQALNTPVLGVVREGVNHLTQALRAGLADGTVGRFGEILAKAFDAARRGLTDFLRGLDVEAIIARMQGIAESVGEGFARIGNYASTAGQSVQTAWSVMTAGVNGVMTVVYALGSAFSWVVAGIQKGVTLILEGLSKITLGGLSEKFRAAAEEVRRSAESTNAATEALARKSEESFHAMADAAHDARAGFIELVAPAEQVGRAVDGSAEKTAEAAKALSDLAEAADQAKPAMEGTAQTAQDMSDAVLKLHDEYKALVASGDLQAATEKLLEVQKAKSKLAQSSEEAASKAQLVEQAYRDLGLKTKEELKQAADQAKSAYETIKRSGTESPQRVKEAFREMAEAVIAANNGTAPSWLKAQAGAHGFAVQTDETGKSVLKLQSELDKAGDKAKDMGDKGKEGADKVGDAAEEAADKVALAGQKIETTWLSAAARSSQYSEEAARHAHELAGAMEIQGGALMTWGQYYQSVAEHLAKLGRLADEYVAQMELLDQQAQQIEQRSSGGLRDLDDLEMRLLELEGTREQVSQAKRARELREMQAEQELLRIELQRAQLRGESKEVERIQAELQAYERKLQVLGRVHEAERKAEAKHAAQARAKERERAERERAQAAAPSTPSAASGGGQQHQVIDLRMNGSAMGRVSTDEAGAAALQRFMGELERSARLTGAL